MDWETKIGSLGPIGKNTQSFSQDSEGLYPKRKRKPKRASSHKDWNATLNHFSSFLDQANLSLFQYLPEEKTILPGKICHHPQPQKYFYAQYLIPNPKLPTIQQIRANLWKPGEKTVEMNLSGGLNIAIIYKH